MIGYRSTLFEPVWCYSIWYIPLSPVISTIVWLWFRLFPGEVPLVSVIKVMHKQNLSWDWELIPWCLIMWEQWNWQEETSGKYSECYLPLFTTDTACGFTFVRACVLVVWHPTFPGITQHFDTRWINSHYCSSPCIKRIEEEDIRYSKRIYG